MESGELIMPGPGKQGVDRFSTEHSQRNVVFWLRFQEGKFGVNCLGGGLCSVMRLLKRGISFTGKSGECFQPGD